MAANGKWRNLPSDLLLEISERLDSDFGLLRLRSVCRPWRSQLPPPQNPIPFPLNLPPISDYPLLSHLSTYLPFPYNGRYTLHQISYYHISSPGNDNPSNGRLLKVSETSPNTFLLLPTPTPGSSNLRPPNELSLLDYRISEVRKSYAVYFHRNSWFTSRYESAPLVKKTIVLRNYGENFDFVVLILTTDRKMSYWRIGDVAWTPINTSDSPLEDVILCHGICYALDNDGGLYCFDQNLTLTLITWVILFGEPDRLCLVECESELYVVVKSGIVLPLLRLKVETNFLQVVRNLGDMFLVWCDDEMISLRATDFRGCTGNSVYLIDSHVIDGEANAMAMAYDLYYGRSFVHGIWRRDSSRVNWCRPGWLRIAKCVGVLLAGFVFGARYFYKPMAMVYRSDERRSFVYGIWGRDSSWINWCTTSWFRVATCVGVLLAGFVFGARYFYRKGL